jgi:hypothetical protein
LAKTSFSKNSLHEINNALQKYEREAAMKRILFLVFIACAVFCGSWVQARTQAEALAQQKQARAQKKLEREKKLEVLKELKEKGNQCGSANNAVGSEAYKACRACNNSVYPVKRRGSVEDIARARKLCDKALLLMNPETREDASGRRELEALQEKMENAYADIKYKDPNMSDDRINVICTEYEKHFAYTLLSTPH